MTGEPVNILFLCPNNACRSIIAEALLNKVGQGRFRAFSAGPKPQTQINSYVVETLKQVGYDTADQYPKSWDGFVVPTAPRLDAVITLSDQLKDQQMPIWYSNPVLVHWHFDDPEQVGGSDIERIGAFRRCYGLMEQQMLKLASLPLDGVRGEPLLQQLQAVAPLDVSPYGAHS